MANMLNITYHEYDGTKPRPEYWAGMLSNEEFQESFQIVYHYIYIPGSDYYTPEVLEYTCINMEVAIYKDAELPEFSHVNKRLWDENDITI